MAGKGDFKFSPIPLKASVLETPFEIQTAWYVISGAPSSGKTTLIHQLADQGFQVAEEGARRYMEGELAKGRTIEDIHGHPVQLQHAILAAQLEVERHLPPNACVFLDSAVPDCLAWYRAFGLDPNCPLRECFHFRYASVFVLDPLPLSLDGLRFDEHALPTFLHQWHVHDYSALGYQVTAVPALPPEARLAFVLECAGMAR